MTLRWKTLTAVAVTFAALVAVLVATSQFVVLRGFRVLEEERAVASAERALSVLRSELSRVVDQAGDWSVWDPTYQFVVDGNQQYITDNLADSSFEETGTSFIAFVAADGRLVYGKAFDKVAGTQTELPADLLAHLDRSSPLVAGVDVDSEAAGFVVLDEGIAILGSRPILTSAGDGPSRGVVVIGRMYDDDLRRKLEESTLLDIRLLRLDDARESGLVPSELEATGRGVVSVDAVPVADILVHPVSGDVMSGATLLPDIDGDASLFLGVRMPRPEYRQGLATMLATIIILCVAALVFGLLVLGVLERLVLAPLNRLTGDLGRIRQAGDGRARLDPHGADEIGRLSDDINLMLASMEAVQAESRERERQCAAAVLLEALPAYAYLKDLEGRYVTANKRFCAAVGRELSEIVGRADEELFPQETAELYRAQEAAFLFSDSPFVVAEEEFSDRGRSVPVAGRLTRLTADDGSTVGLAGLKLDITDRKLTEMALFQEKERAQVTLRSIGDGVITTDVRGLIQYMNPMAELLTGRDADDVWGSPLHEVFRVLDEQTRRPLPDPVQRCLREGNIVVLEAEAILVRADGAEFSIQDSAAPIRDSSGEIIGGVLVFHDESEHRRMAREIAYRTTHDPATGLINRIEFESRLARALEGARIEGAHHSLCYLDLDQFRVVNDTFGHLAGDELVKRVAGVLRTVVRESDLVARLGGDEFGVLLLGCEPGRALALAEKVRRAVREIDFSWSGERFEVGASIGVVHIDQAVAGVTEVMRAAGSACLVAKDAGRNRVHVYRADDEALARRQGEMESLLRITKALEEDRFCLYYQRIVPVDAGGASITDGAAAGIAPPDRAERSAATDGAGPPESAPPEHGEVLVRMIDEAGGIVLPGAFLPAAEHYGLMPTIDRWVVREALARLGRHGDRVLSVNLSGQSLADGEFMVGLLAQIDEAGVDASRLCFEVTETAAVANLAAAVRFMTALKHRGCRFALDDFGSGVSSFAYLRTLPVDYLKIDGHFVRDMARDPVAYAMVEAINSIGHVLGLQTVAEFVEDEPILAGLREIGVDWAQGYGVHRPEPLT